jgi:hypothetical protein
MKRFTNLESLSLENVCLTDEVLSTLPCLPTLHTLRLVCCDSITPAAMDRVYEHATALKNLKLESCIMIDSIGVFPVTLTRIALVNMGNVGPRDTMLGIQGCKGLKYLDLSMGSVDDEGLKGILKEVGELRELVVSGCGGLVNLDGIVGKWAGVELRRLEKSRGGVFQPAFAGRPGLEVVFET